MALEGFAILLLGFWLVNEYNYSSSFRSSLNDLVFTRVTAWTSVLGLSAGLIGSVVAIGAWRSLRRMRDKIRTLEQDLLEASRRLQEKPSASVLKTASGPVEPGGPLAIVHSQPTALALIPGQASSA